MISQELRDVMAKIASDRARAGLGSDYFDVRATRSSTPPTDMPLPENITIEYVLIDGVACYWAICADGDPDLRIVYFHGGGYTNGGFHNYRSLVGWLAHATRAAVLFVEYRLAPEYRFPAAVEDCQAVLQAAFSVGPANRRHRASSVTAAGDSAGAALAVAALLKAREARGQMPSAAVLLCGMFDLDETTSPFLRSAQRVRDMVRLYVSHLADLRDPLASPILADLQGLPRMLVQTGSEDFCLEDNLRFAERAKSHGVEVTLEVWPGMIHIWQRYVPVVPEARQALDGISKWLNFPG